MTTQEQPTKARYLKVGWIPPQPPPIWHGCVTVDMGEEYDAPTDADMQRITFAAKMEFAKILRERKRAGKRTK